MSINIYNNNLNGSDASVVRNMHVIEAASHSPQEADNEAILQELRELRRKVSEKFGSEAAESVDDMRRAVEDDKPSSLKDIVGKLKDEAFKYIRDNAPTLMRKFLGL